MKKNKPYLIGIILVFVFFLLSGYISLRMFRQTSAAQVEEVNAYYLEQDSARVVERLNTKFRDSKTYLQNVSDVFAESSIEDFGEMQRLLDRLAEDAPFDNLYFAYADGNLYRSSGENQNISDREYFKKALEGESGITEVLHSRMSDKEAIMFYAPVTKQGEVCAVIIGVYHVENLKTLLETGFEDESMYSAIIDREGGVIVGSDSQLQQKNMLEELVQDRLITEEDVKDIKKDMSNGDAKVFTYKGSNGEALLIYKPLEVNSWYVVQRLRSVVLKNMREERNRATYFFVLEISVGFIGLFLAVYLLLRRRYNELYVENQRIQAIVDGSESLIFERDEKLKKTFWYGDAHQQFQMENGSGDILELIYPGDREKFENGRNTLQKGNDCNMDIRIRNYSGEYLWCSCQLVAIKTPSGRIVGTLGIIRNVDEQKKREVLLTDERDLLTEGIDLLRDTYFSIKMLNLFTGKCRYLKADEAEKAGVKQSENYEGDLQRVAEELVHPDFRERFLESFSLPVLREAAAKGSLHQTLIYQRKKKGDSDYKWVQTEFISCKNPSEAMIYVRDITEEWVAEEEHKHELQHAYEEVSKANRVKTEFMQHISHDFRTPMNAIIGQNQLAHLELEKGNTEQADYYIKNVHASSEYLMRLLSDMLDMAYFLEGKLQLEDKAFSVEELASSCRRFFEYASGNREVDFQVECEVSGVYEGDYLRIKQMIFNLLENAVKFNKPGGSVFLQIYSEDTGRGKTRFHITVCDTGKGMDEAQKACLFKAFGRGRRIVSETHCGTGMGLAIVKYIIDAMGGEISIESEAGAGTKAELWFELSKAAENETTLEVGDFSKEEKTVLIVDDNLLNLEVANEMVKSEGFQTITAESGAEALKILAETPVGGIDVLLTDISMPEMDGYELTAAVRAQQREDIRNLYVIALSAYGYEECCQKFNECGMDAFLNKPFDVSAFVRLMAEREGEK